MRTLPASFTVEKNKQYNINPWLVLVEIQISVTESIYITNHHIPVISNGDTYDPFSIEVEGLESVLSSDILEFGFKISNISREIMQKVEAADGLVGYRLRYQLVNLANVNDTYTEDFEIVNCVVNERDLDLTVAYFFLVDAQFPGAFFSRDRCHWEFGSTECGFNINDPGQYDPNVDSPCTKRKNGNFGCIFWGDREVANGNPRLHPERYGAFPSIPLISNRLFSV